MQNDDWMEQVERAKREAAEAIRRKADAASTAGAAFSRLAPVFVADVFAQIDADVEKWNARPGASRIASVLAEADKRCFLNENRTLTIRYLRDLQLIDVDIAVGDGVYIAPNIVADSYELKFDGNRIIATRHGTSRRGVLHSANEISRDVLTAFLT